MMRIIPISGPAARYIQILVDYGHLTDVAADELAVAVADHAAETGVERVGVADVRRMAAAMLWQSGTPVLGEDWPYLFS